MKGRRVDLRHLAGQFVFGEKDEHSWPPKPSHKGFIESPGGRRKFFALKSSTRLAVCSRVSPLDELSANRMSAQPKVRKDIPKIIFVLVSATKKVF